MEAFVAALTVPDLAGAVRQGASHPTLGPFLKSGTYCTIEGVTGAEVLDAARAAGQGIEVLGGLSPADLAGAGERGGLCLIVEDRDGQSRPLAILYGRGLPVLGAIPACTVADLRHTWTALAGGTPAGGRHLLHEQPEAWDPQIERQLTQRLRQLYGE